MRLAKDKYGCGTLHRCLEAGDDSQKMQLGMAVGRNARPMATDAHGNYILQNVMAMDKPPPKEAAIDALSGAFVALSKHKFGSNVVEKCVSAGEWALQVVMGEVFAVKNGVEDLLGDRYGNFVMQAIIKKCKVDGELLHTLRARITDYERAHAGWSESLVGVRILQKLNKRLRSARALELREAAANEQEHQVAQLLDEPEPEPESGRWKGGEAWQGSDDAPRGNRYHNNGQPHGREHGAGPGRRQRTPAQQQRQKEKQQARIQDQQRRMEAMQQQTYANYQMQMQQQQIAQQQQQMQQMHQQMQQMQAMQQQMQQQNPMMFQQMQGNQPPNFTPVQQGEQQGEQQGAQPAPQPAQQDGAGPPSNDARIEAANALLLSPPMARSPGGPDRSPTRSPTNSLARNSPTNSPTAAQSPTAPHSPGHAAPGSPGAAPNSPGGAAPGSPMAPGSPTNPQSPTGHVSPSGSPTRGEPPSDQAPGSPEQEPVPTRRISRMPFGNRSEPTMAAEVDTLTAALDAGVLRAFLASQGLEKFESVLADNEVRNLETLCMLQEEDLSELGMLKGPRVKMLRTMKAWQAEQNKA